MQVVEAMDFAPINSLLLSHFKYTIREQSNTSISVFVLVELERKNIERKK